MQERHVEPANGPQDPTPELLCRQRISSFRAQLTRERIESRRLGLARLLASEEAKLAKILTSLEKARRMADAGDRLAP
ncbi:MAG: hypothetical protein JO127_18430 [Caulobacteraceae bacterium]|nr:hypothetical protein [Caulobacteraceae bacterium]